MSRIPTWLTFLLCMLMSATALGHQRAQAKLEVTSQGDRTLVALELHEDDLAELLDPKAHLLGQVPAEIGVWRAETARALPGWLVLKDTGRPCGARLEGVTRVGLRGVRVTAQARCGADQVTWHAGVETGLDLRAVTKLTGADGAQARAVLHRGSPMVRLADAGWLSEVWHFVALGVEHIVTGWDHLAFLLALLLACSTFGRALWVVSGFTIAHSVTLVMGAMGVVMVSGEIVEPIIALSIALAAGFELVRPEREEPEEGVPRAEIAMCLGFGLVHGLGFAGMLAEALGSRSGDLIVPVLSFNVGVELGQLVLVMAAFPLIVWMRADARTAWMKQAMLLGLVALGLCVAAARVL